MTPEEIYSLIQCEWILNIVKNMIYQDMVQKIFYDNLSIENFVFEIPNLYLVVNEEKINVLDNCAFMFIKASHFTRARTAQWR